MNVSYQLSQSLLPDYVQHQSSQRVGRIFGLFDNSEDPSDSEPWIETGLDPVEFLKLSRTGQSSSSREKFKRQRKKNNRRLVAQASSGYGKKRKKEILEINKVPRAEFLIPESYDAEPDCAPAGSISGFTFINFVLSAASVAANLVNNANSNNNNNNNNNNDNNDNVNNINVANNNNAGNNVNDIQICPFPCLPQPPPIINSNVKDKINQRLKYFCRTEENDWITDLQLFE